MYFQKWKSLSCDCANITTKKILADIANIRYTVLQDNAQIPHNNNNVDV